MISVKIESGQNSLNRNAKIEFRKLAGEEPLSLFNQTLYVELKKSITAEFNEITLITKGLYLIRVNTYDENNKIINEFNKTFEIKEELKDLTIGSLSSDITLIRID
jgi:hypothetical protein